jgi:Bacterial lectin
MQYSYPVTCLTQPLSAVWRAGAIVPLLVLVAFIVPVSADFTFQDFSDTTGLTLVGSAEVINQRLRLTPDLGEQAGAAWFITKQSVAGGFETTFQVHIGGDGADGFAFVIQNHDIAAPGGCCGGQGYEFIPNSLAIEFDTWQNIPEDFPSGIGDPSENHVSVQTRGLLPNSADPVFSLGTTTDIPYLSDDNPHTVKITYTPGSLRIFVDDLDTPALVVAVNLATLLDLDDGQAWVGLTAGTGGISETHDILNWSFTEGSISIITVVIDIKPGSDTNPINPKSNGVIPVAILTTDTFDATTVDPLSVRFGSKDAKEAHNKGHIEDSNKDGEPDLVLHFKTQATGIKCDDTSASLTGETFDGDPIQGSDAIKTVGCKK